LEPKPKFSIGGLLKTILIVGFSHGFVYLNMSLRGIVLARILGPHDYGLALILIMVTGALDLFADAGIDRFVVQNRFGYRRDVMSTAHAFRVFGSAVVGLAIVLLAYPVAHAFHAPNLVFPIASTGGIVAIRGFANLTFKLQQRDHRFEREAWISASVCLVELITTTAVAFATKSYLSVLVGAYANAITVVILTQILARGRYSFIPRTRLIGLVTRFSAPIYLNAALLLAAGQGDRLVIAASFSKGDLAFYSAASAIGSGISGLAGAMMMNIMLPRLAPRGHTSSAPPVNLFTGAVILLSVVYLIGMTLVGPFLVGLLYGPAFAGLGALVFAAAITQMIQLEQGWLTTLLMANGLTRRFPLITIVRAAAFPAALVMAKLGVSILAVPLAFAFGATLSLAVSYHAARQRKLVDKRLIALSFTRVALGAGGIVFLLLRG
jgi:O-antigen/teichoic acid export membrane protein